MTELEKARKEYFESLEAWQKQVNRLLDILAENVLVLQTRVEILSKLEGNKNDNRK